MSLPSQPSPDERRRAPRLNVHGRIESRLEPPAQTVTVRDLSLGGFLLESDDPFPVEAIHHFRMATPNGWATVLTARCVHCQHRAQASGYLAGFAFVEPTGTEGHERVIELIDQVSSVLSFDEATPS